MFAFKACMKVSAVNNIKHFVQKQIAQEAIRNTTIPISNQPKTSALAIFSNYNKAFINFKGYYGEPEKTKESLTKSILKLQKLFFSY